MSDSRIDPSVTPDKVPEPGPPGGHDDTDHPSNPDKTGEPIDGKTDRPEPPT